MTLVTLSLGLVPQPLSSTPFVPPIRMTRIHCFNHCLMNNSVLYHVDHLVLKVAASVSIVLTGLPSSTSVDQDASSPSTSQTPQVSTSHVIAPDVKEVDHDIKVSHMDKNP
uniref:Uncharacterized protein n=1 Tax=Tanacetum cinerariifolium TaxID=118510 RepID=A0A699LDI8_TANCI|nr:hypothetical protein [Tanacetum cinerariifolium]